MDHVLLTLFAIIAGNKSLINKNGQINYHNIVPYVDTAHFIQFGTVCQNKFLLGLNAEIMNLLNTSVYSLENCFSVIGYF